MLGGQFLSAETDFSPVGQGKSKGFDEVARSAGGATEVAHISRI
jgi:hypothetical protein